MDKQERFHSPQFRFGLMAAAVLVACAVGGVAMRMSEASLHSGTDVCLSVGPGVCLSGSADWVMQNARKPGEIHTAGLPVISSEAE
jgi:hypothetical protein